MAKPNKEFDFEQFRRDWESLNLKNPVKNISEKLKKSPSNISSYLNGKIVPSSSFLELFYKSFNIKPGSGGPPEEKTTESEISTREFIEYLKLENERKQKLLETSLAEILSKSVAIQGHVMSLLQLEVEKAVGADPQKQTEKLGQLSKNSAANAGVLQVKDT
ncbi:MAG: hypothetical protein KAF40_01435 [Flavihumibacter sp.]|nr:hypothetical protein [Flavihumibacter sp.]